MSKPSNWPCQVVYSDKLIFSKTIPLEIVSIYLPKHSSSRDVPVHIKRRVARCPPRGSLDIHQRPSSSHINIISISDPKHPAYKQSGLFAAKKLPKDAFVCEYIGSVHIAGPSGDISQTSDYVLGLDTVTDAKGNSISLAVDAEKCGNEGRFVNDFRGVADKPNVQFDLFFDLDAKAPRMGIWTLREIKKGEELLVSYGKGFWQARHLFDE